MAIGGWLAESVLHFYGVLFLVVGGLFFYWSARGLLAYQRGMREAWTDPLACAAGLIAGVACWWAAKKMIREKLIIDGSRGLSREEEAMLETVEELEKTDPAAAEQLLDNFYIRRGEAEERRRDELRRLAPHDIRAALELRQALRKDRELNALARKEFAKDLDEPKRGEFFAPMDSDDRAIEAELGQLDAAIERLRLKDSAAGN